MDNKLDGRVRALFGIVLGVSIATVEVAAIVRGNAAVWIRGVIVTAIAAVLIVLAKRAFGGQSRRVRADAADVDHRADRHRDHHRATAYGFPAWMKVEQAVVGGTVPCGRDHGGHRRPVRQAFAKAEPAGAAGAGRLDKLDNVTTQKAASASRNDQITRAAERGYHATSFETICEKAALSSKRLITYHFSSKDELFEAVAARVVADAEAFVVPVALAAPDGTRAWDRHHSESVSRLAGLFADGQRTGEFRRCDPLITAAALRATLDSTYEPLSTGLDPDRCANERVELFDRANRPA